MTPKVWIVLHSLSLGFNLGIFVWLLAVDASWMSYVINLIAIAIAASGVKLNIDKARKVKTDDN